VRTITPERVLREVGRRIAELRIAKGLTQEQLAERLDVATRWVQGVEGGAENLTLGTLTTFCDVLRVPMIEVFRPPTSPKSKPGRPARRAR
jgi:transcriptional regulator with XRE-family HTH domain